MKIGIIGTRGIPNRYGGFEQFAEYIAPLLVQKGHDVTVYNSSAHPYQQNVWKGVHIVKRNDPENKIGTAGQFFYDLNCILHCRSQQFDIILQLGYTSSSIWTFLLPKNSLIITNMDGLEWKRSKYNNTVKRFLKFAEKLAVKYSNALIADSPGIQQYLRETYHKNSFFIAYGAELIKKTDDTLLKNYQLVSWNYYLLIARPEPENNIEMIIKGFLNSQTLYPLIIIGNTSNTYGMYLKQKYSSVRVQFTGAIYDINLLNQLRYYSLLYFHGHSVGGTNPSLLEAMASEGLIAAHDNVFNKAVTGKDAFYFASEHDVTSIIDDVNKKENYKTYIDNNIEKIKSHYNWPTVASELEKCFLHVLEKKS